VGHVSDADLTGYKVELPEFEGPLDLLLHLVKKHELSIVDIPIAFITDQYLKMLGLMEQMNIEIAAEYLLMAATLCHLKSRELVPPDPAEEAALAAAEAEEEGADPRQELIRRLLEYQKYKDAAAQLLDRPVMGRNVWPRGAKAEDIAGMHVLPGGAPLAEVPVIHLIESLEQVLSRAKVTLTHDVLVDRTTISDKINELVDRLEAEGSFTFESCFAFVEKEQPLVAMKHQVVVTFLAILEMTRVKLIRLTQPEERGSIYISRSTDEADLRAQVEEMRKKTEEYK
jgi:segregation and condensation protein A